MQMTKLGYFAEFGVLPAFLILAGVYAYDVETHPEWTIWVAAILAGAVAWTLLEYLLHRFVFHNAPIISDMHESHHEQPLALIGAPAWISLTAGIVGVLCPLWSVIGLPLAVAATSGVTLGYLWYVAIHYATHHWQPRHGSYLYRRRLHHMRHHYAPDRGNFGVTTAIWDRVFGTTLERITRGSASTA